MTIQTDGVTNRLINEKSPYLLQHAYNPVDWYPWGDEAFSKAMTEDKPIFLSIGYSTCHWCHVMERESFEDLEVAKILNDSFVSIKVDREERPDIDSIYMHFCQMVTGSGGWPLTVFLDPKDKKPFFVGTYFPKTSNYGHPGIIDVLSKITEIWNNEREKLKETSDNIIDAINDIDQKISKDVLNKEIIHEAYKDLSKDFDKEYGGFGTAPKFPTPSTLLYLLRYYSEYKKKDTLEIITKTLDSMYRGGIFDHIGYGFSRYSTDRQWLVPHFEKMLYDNALLIIAYTEAYQVTKNDEYKYIAEKIIEYITREMISEEGGFYSAEDADSEGVEGKFYVFSKEEIINVLGEEDGDDFCRYYNITDEGNFEGKNIFNLINTNIQNIDKAKLESNRKKLFEYREKRVHPFKDDKILTSWNGLMIAAFSIAGRVFKRDTYLEKAGNAINFIMDKMFDDRGNLFARYRLGEAGIHAYLDDYAFLAWGLIEMYEATLIPYYLEKAVNLTDDMILNFWNKENGGFYLYGKNNEQLFARPKEIYDGAIPSGNSVATMNMLRLSHITADIELKEKAISQFKTFSEIVRQAPKYYAFFLSAFLYSLAETKDIVITGFRNNPKSEEIIKYINNKYLPFVTIIYNDGDPDIYELVPHIEEQNIELERVAVYICEAGVCKSPIYSIEELKNIL